MLDILEAQVLPDQSSLPLRLHPARGIHHLRHRLLLPDPDRTERRDPDWRHLHIPHAVRVPDEV